VPPLKFEKVCSELTIGRQIADSSTETKQEAKASSLSFRKLEFSRAASLKQKCVLKEALANIPFRTPLFCNKLLQKANDLEVRIS
jgi:hypothetical protein